MKEITKLQRLSFGHGFCWENYDRGTITTCLVPFNFILRWGRELYFWLAKPRGYLEHKAYHKGYSEGKEEAIKLNKNI